jgi:hypothetical protein
MQEFEAQMDEYKKTDTFRKYQQYMNDFKAQQLQPSLGKRPVMSRSTTDSSNNTRVWSRASPSSSDSPTSVPPLASMGKEAEVCHNALTLAFSELVLLRGEILNDGSRPYDEIHLPPEDLIRRSMLAFIRGTGSLLFMWTFEQADEILDRVYRPKKKVEAMDLAECFTVAAMGAHYDMDCLPDRTRKVLYASGSLHFHEQTARQDYFRTMRLLLSMSFYALLEKHMSARYLIGKSPIGDEKQPSSNLFAAAGLQIARWKCPAPHSSSAIMTGNDWKRILRSLIFMDSWLSYTLGYTSEVTPSDIDVRGRAHTSERS